MKKERKKVCKHQWVILRWISNEYQSFMGNGYITQEVICPNCGKKKRVI